MSRSHGIYFVGDLKVVFIGHAVCIKCLGLKIAKLFKCIIFKTKFIVFIGRWFIHARFEVLTLVPMMIEVCWDFVLC